MSFFLRKRSKPNENSKPLKKSVVNKKKTEAYVPPAKRKKRKVVDDDEIPSDSDSDLDQKGDEEYLSEEDVETAQEKRLRLAKQYLSKLDEQESLQQQDEESKRDLISHRLKQDVLEQTGRLHRYVANDYLPTEAADILVLRGHKLSLTCLVITPDDRFAFTGSKDCNIIKWDLQTKQRVHVIKGGKKIVEKMIGHRSHVLALAISSDGKFLVSGDCHNLIHVWNPDDCNHIHTFKGHRDSISGLVFRKGSHQLFSASHDRAVKIWNLDEMSYVETLFGHQDKITSIDSLTRDRALTSGGTDRSVRIWKVIEESQLVFHGHSGSIDCVSLINEQYFVSGADNNTISLWSLMKKKPIFTVKNAHSKALNNNCQETKEENWITAVISFQNTDLVASGSKDGCVRLWKCAENYKSLDLLFTVPVVGFVNSLQFSSDGNFIVAAVGQEHKLGRWWKIKDAKNCLVVIPLRKKDS